MPDALSKTVPIWIAVLNRTLFPEAEKIFHDIRVPEIEVSMSERDQIRARLEGFVQDLQMLKLPLDALRVRITKPMLPEFVTPGSMLPRTPPRQEDHHHLVLVSASKRVRGAEASGGGYVQGAGDDSEGWARGLTPGIWWENKKTLMATPEQELGNLIDSFVSTCRSQSSARSQAVLIQPTCCIYVASTVEPIRVEEWDAVIDCNSRYDGLLSSTEGQTTGQTRAKVLRLNVDTGKMGSRQLRKELPKLRTFLDALDRDLTACSRILACFPDEKDISIGVALALLCLLTDEDGGIHGYGSSGVPGTIDKLMVRRKLSWIMSSVPDAKPSRATLNAVNAFLMERIDT